MPNPTSPGSFSRRQFLQQTAAAALLAGLAEWRLDAAEATPTAGGAEKAEPWFRRTRRWGQVNLTEKDAETFDVAAWREQWRRTCLQGVVVNAGGIVAYYPTQVPGHRRAAFLGARDLFGEIRAAAKAEGLAVLARMDSNRADEAFFRPRPEWLARDAAGRPYVVTDLEVACINSGYYDEYLPAILREVATRYRPEGFADNNWNGPMRNQPCFCANCERKFRARTGEAIPRTVDWNSRLYREWITWNYERRLEVWELFNRTTREAGGPECIWVGMMAGSLNWQSRVFRDDREIYRRTELVMLDHQRRPEAEGFAHNAETGKRIHGVGGWDKLIPESMAMYQATEHNFRLTAKAEPEVRLWALDGFAGGIQPWWHHLGGSLEDRRALKTAVPLWQWHREHEEFLVNRRPVATVGMLWSQRNMDFFGRDEAGSLVDDPWNGWALALGRARIPWLPVHVDDVERDAAEFGLRVLILPNLAALSDAQVAAIRRFAERGGSVIATGLSSLCDEWGDVRGDLALAEILGVHVPAGHGWRDERKRGAWARDWTQTYLRLADGPRSDVLRGFEETALLPFGGMVEPLTIDPGASVPLTYVPPVPLSPPEAVWLREPRTDVAGLVLREKAGGSRVAHLAADVDRRFARDHLPEHGDLLANLVRWALRDELPLHVTGKGLVDCELYRQGGRLILHVVNLTNAGTWRAPVHELIPIGPLEVAVRVPAGLAPRRVRSLVTGRAEAAVVRDGWVSSRMERVEDHDVLVFE